MSFRIFKSSKNTFEGIHADETVLLLIRKHWFILLVELVGILLAGFVLFVVLVGILIFIDIPGLKALLFLLASICLLFMWYTIFYVITMYYLNTWILTNHRIIENHMLGLFKRVVDEISLSKIQDISTDVEGIIETFLGYGDLQVQSAGTEAKFKMTQVPHPELIKEKIAHLSGTYAPPPNTSKT